MTHEARNEGAEQTNERRTELASGDSKPTSGNSNSTGASRRRFLGAVGAAGLAGASVVGTASAQTPTLNILTWEEYGDPAIVKPIEEQVGVNIQITKSTSSAKMFSSWNAGQYRQYDIAIPNNNYVPKFMAADLVAPVPQGVVQHQQAMYDKFRQFQQNQFTSQGDLYGVPIRFGWYGYSYDSRKLSPDHEKSYDALFNANYEGANLKGKIVMYDNHFKAMSATALYLGMQDAFKGQKVTLSESQIQKVKQKLIDQKPLLQGYIAADPTYIKSFKQGNFVVGQSGRNEVIEMRANGTNWPRMATPKEGSLAWFESAVVSKASSNKKKAWQVVNQYISPKLGAKLAQVGYSPSVNPKTSQYLNKRQQDLYGSIKPQRLSEFIPFKAVENERQWIQAWEEVKTA
ncbi:MULTISPECIES: ABC transporter substrate-binding protein [Halorussus]|uniref:ABC transporter substrate-binding protein n=1 Tax=Halorussus TaxID=1070314 RepID=UPI0020A02B79|nr:PotD/PotF family extracellular solute-binding protein [Halorussus vallis]USZ74069.1 PotD/PotF family extracellular solute-binding protein [Halorussus vallis]